MAHSPRARASAAALVGVACLVAAGCAGLTGRRLVRETGESVVFVGGEPAALAHPVAPGTVLVVRSAYRPGPGVTVYTEGLDYECDRAAGTLRRLAASRLPDFRTNVLYGREDFDHSKFPGFGNNGFFAFVDYAHVPAPARAPAPSPQLRRTRAILREGGSLKIVAFGDSITAGGEATTPDLIFWNRWAQDLRQKHPGANITAINGATGGDRTVEGLQRLQDKVLNARPDLVLIGFGMNDHNRGGVSLADFGSNLRKMIGRIRSETAAEIVLFSAFPPNPKWKFGAHHMEDYAAATERTAAAEGCAYADVFHLWQTYAARKKPEDMLGNNINHPNDFGHAIYAEALLSLGL